MNQDFYLQNKKLLRIVNSILLFSVFLSFSSRSQNIALSAHASLAEKIYLQLDSKVYTTDKTIWFKSVVTHATDHGLTTLSGVLYAELIDPDEKIIERKLIKLEKGVGDGFFDLKESYREGLYLIRAYTEWNKNFDTDFIFQEYIHVFAASVKDVVDPISKVTLIEKQNNERRLNAYFNPFAIDSLHKNKLTLFISLNDKKETLYIKENAENKYLIDYAIPDECQFVTLEIQTENLFKFSKTIVLDEEYIDLQFFPESGELVHGIQSVVGFKALDYSGRGKSVEGEIVDGQGKVLTTFKGNQLGMGSFFLSEVDSNATYFARLTAQSEENLSKMYSLPTVAPKGNVLSVIYKEREILIIASSNYLKNESIYIRSSCRGAIYHNVKGSLKNGVLVLSVPVDELPEGIVSFTMMDSPTNPVAERLYFNERPENRINIGISTDKDIYGQRELTTLNIETTDVEGEPINSNLSLLVVNKGQMGQMQSMRQNILSYFLLSSDLKGEVEDPGFYFMNGNDRAVDIDALLLTQGWRKYKYTKPLDKIVFQPEAKLSVSGTADGTISLGKKEVVLTMMTFGNLRSFDKQTADSLGKFKFYLNDEYGQDVGLIIQSAKSSGKKKNFKITLDKKDAPAITFNHKKEIEKIDSVVHALIEKNMERKKVEDDFPISSGDINLEEIVVEGYNMTPERKKVIEDYGEPYKVITGEEIVEKEEDWSYGLYGALVKNYPNDIIIHQDDSTDEYVAAVVGGGVTLVIIEGIPVLEYDYPMIPYIPTSEVSSFEIIKNANNFAKIYREVYPRAGTQTGLTTSLEENLTGRDLILPGNGSIIAIYTHAGRGILGVRKAVGVAQTTIPVFSSPREFYAPKYENIKPGDWYKPDLRALVFWKPKMMVDDLGKVSATFYNADNIGEMQVVVEAIAENGEIGYQELFYDVEKNQNN